MRFESEKDTRQGRAKPGAAILMLANKLGISVGEARLALGARSLKSTKATRVTVSGAWLR